ncbi:MAG: tyrosine-type recombinase/integrase [Thermoleophilia bacterium]
MKRQKTNYPGVYFREQDGERIFYIRYRLPKTEGSFKQVEEVAGRSRRDNMTPAKASHLRTKRMQGEQLPNQERRAARKKKTWTLSALWEEYQELNPGHKNHASDSTLYNRYLAPRFADKQPADILVLDIDRLTRRELKDKSPQTQAHALELLRRLCNFGLKRGLCRGLTFTVQMPRLDNVKTEDLDPVQLRKLLEVIDHHTTLKTPSCMAAYAMHLVLLTGLRRGELFRLKWDDINWHRWNITLHETKGGRTQTIPLSSYAERLLKEIREIGNESEFVFPGRGGGQLTTMVRPVNKIKAEASLPPDFRPLHGLRHLFGTNLGNAGVDRDIIARLMTHARDRSVTSRYVHYREETLREAAELAGRLVEEVQAEKVVQLNA